MASKDQSEMLYDALLKVAVSEAFQKEMEQLPSNKELNETYKPSPELDRQIKRFIDQYRRKSKIKRLIKSFGKIAACIVIIFMVLATAALSVEATRNMIFNTVIEWREKYTEIQFQDSATDSEQNIYRPAYLPEGFKKTSIEKFGKNVMLVYANEAGDEILFNQGPAKAGTSLVDNENTNYREVEISGSTAYLFEALKENESSVLIWQSDGIVFKLISPIDSADLIRIGSSLKR